MWLSTTLWKLFQLCQALVSGVTGAKVSKHWQRKVTNVPSSGSWKHVPAASFEFLFFFSFYVSSKAESTVELLAGDAMQMKCKALRWDVQEEAPLFSFKQRASSQSSLTSAVRHLPNVRWREEGGGIISKRWTTVAPSGHLEACVYFVDVFIHIHGSCGENSQTVAFSCWDSQTQLWNFVAKLRRFWSNCEFVVLKIKNLRLALLVN